MPIVSLFDQGPPRLRHYALAVLATVACTLVRLALNPWLDNQAPLVVFIFGIMVTAVVGGFWPGLLATILSVLASHYFFYLPRWAFFSLARPYELLSLFLFGLCGLFISCLCQVLRRTEETSRRRLAELQSIYASAPIGLGFMDSELRYRSINARLAAINGRPAAEHLGHTFREVLPDYLADVIEPIHRQILQTGQPVVNHEISAVSPAQPGILRHWMVNYYPVKDNTGQIIGINSVVQDMTERKQAEDQLKQREADLAEAQAMSHTGSYRVDLPSGDVTWSAETFRIYGRDPAQGAPTMRESIQLVHPEDRDLCQRVADEACARAMSYTMECRVVRPDGSVRHVYGIGRSFKGPSGEIAGLFGTIMDITDRKRAEQALKESEERFRLAVEAARMMAWDYNPRTDQLTWTNTDGVWGEAPQITMTLDQFLASVHAQDRETVQQATRRALDPAGSGEYMVEYRLIRRDGTIQWRTARGRAFFAGEGPQRQPVRCIGVTVDITKRKRAEEALLQAKEQAEAASAAKDQFLASLSHELRTPLTPVLAAVSLLERNNHLEAESREDVQMIRRNVELEARLIDDLLDLTRIVRGKLELRPKLVDVRQILQHAVDICMPDFKTKDLHVSLPCISERYWVNADSARLQQVFWNLIKNAVKFTPEGGCVGIRCFYSAEQQIVLEVTDSGMGIDPAVLPRIFNAFEQGGRAITRQFGGLGLGLAISKAIVELHGGSIVAESSGLGKGSTFRVTLPAAKPVEPLTSPVPAEEATPTPPAAATDGVSILLVEDHPDTAATLARRLRASGYKVDTATTVQTALQAAQRQHFDLLISDVALPDGSGLDLFRQLRAKHAALQGIAISGYGMEEDIRRSQESGFAEHLVKPLDLKRLEAAIAQLTEVGSH
jgi:two-component system CheB/CheR fusion protein